ncbi:DUF2398 family protein [Arachnia propionica]|uniref:DUF2398 family protein n=1 Tax=Arachnia propionica TaxID=1750 RepID=A0A3P1WPC6_9ACTN|nr:DUF2398 family protein [Arachnia propionica]RRD48111.1 DUF2398 family protein [Arachnia propionica]
MTLSMTRADDADKQRAFLSLLANPVVTPWNDAEAYALVHRHARTLETWCKRMGYRLAHLDQCYRLRRVPVADETISGHRAPPARAVLLLALYAAACLDEHREDSITLQEISDVVRLSAAGRSGWPYDPNSYSHRKLLLRAVELLLRHGVLEVRTDDRLREGWERTGTGIGAGYHVHREALVLLIDTGDVEQALHPPSMRADERGPRLLRRLVETQALYPDELSEEDRTYLDHGGQRLRLAGLAEEMTGGSVEHRKDAVILSLSPDRSLPSEMLVDFPASTALDWAALAMLDRLSAHAEGSFRTVDAALVDRHARQLHAEAGKQLTVELRESPQRLVDQVADRLADLGLLRVNPTSRDWTFLPLAGRYRDAVLDSTPEPAPVDLSGMLFESEER